MQKGWDPLGLGHNSSSGFHPEWQFLRTRGFSVCHSQDGLLETLLWSWLRLVASLGNKHSSLEKILGENSCKRLSEANLLAPSISGLKMSYIAKKKGGRSMAKRAAVEMGDNWLISPLLVQGRLVSQLLEGMNTEGRFKYIYIVVGRTRRRSCQ